MWSLAFGPGSPKADDSFRPWVSFFSQGWPLLWCQLVNPVYYGCIYSHHRCMRSVPYIEVSVLLLSLEYQEDISPIPALDIIPIPPTQSKANLMLIPASPARFNDSIKIIQWLGINKQVPKKSYLNSTFRKSRFINWTRLSFFLFSPVSLTSFTALLNKHIIRKARKVCRNFNLAWHKCCNLTDVISCVSYSH